MSLKTFFCQLFTIFIFFSGTAMSDDYYVDPSGDNSNSGTTLCEPWKTITYALSRATGTAGNQAIIHVAEGTYSTGETFPIRMKDYVNLLGAGADETVIDASGNSTSVILFWGVGDSIIEGFTIQEGRGYRYGNRRYGGGILSVNSSPTIRRNTLYRNRAQWGGGIYMLNSYPIIEDNILTENIASVGGAIFGEGNSTYKINNNTIANNESRNPYPVIIFRGGSYSIFKNNLINNNIGGAMLFVDSRADIGNNTIAYNSSNSKDYADGITSINSVMQIANCIIWNNGDDLLGCDGRVWYSDIEDGDSGAGNISADPQFVGGSPFDYHLSYGSPCIDTGLDIGWRYWGGNPDMGAFEYQEPIKVTSNGVPRMRYVLGCIPVHPVEGTPVGDPAEIIGDDLGGANEYENLWRISRWDINDQAYHRYDEVDDPDVPPVAPGISYWVIQDYMSSPDPTVGAVGYDLVEGWSKKSYYCIALDPPQCGKRSVIQTGNPFNFPIVWGDNYIFNGVESLSIENAANTGWLNSYYAYTWNGNEYIPVDLTGTINSWQGFWVEILIPNMKLCFVPVQAKTLVESSATGGKKNFTEDSWFLELSVTSVSGEYKDTYNGVGIKPEARMRLDIYDALEFTPPLENYVQLYFPHDNPSDILNYWPKSPYKYTYDYHNSKGSFQLWKFEVYSTINNTDFMLTLPNISSIPDSFEILLQDEDKATKVDLRQEGKYNFNSENGIRHFLLISKRKK